MVVIACAVLTGHVLSGTDSGGLHSMRGNVGMRWACRTTLRAVKS